MVVVVLIGMRQGLNLLMERRQNSSLVLKKLLLLNQHVTKWKNELLIV